MSQSSDGDELDAGFSVRANIFKHDSTGCLSWDPLFFCANTRDTIGDLLRRHVVEQDRFRVVGKGLIQLSHRAHFNLDTLACGARSKSTHKDLGYAATERDVIVLDKNSIGKIKPMIGATTAEDGIFFQSTQSGHRLAGIEHTGLRSVNRIDIGACQRGDSTQVLHQVEDHTLATEQRAGIVANDSEHLAIVNTNAVKYLRVTDDFKARFGVVVEPSKNLK
uniref:Uncharacterized protein n=1 Tax=mine drainage metagenome TaxID=410659 RepID=E6PYR3_9ZZZZ